MHESTLRDFFTGAATAAVLRDDLVGTVEELGRGMYRHHVDSLEGEFEVTSQHLVRLCDAVLAGDLPPDALETIGFCLIASDYFCWDGDSPDGHVTGETVHDWSGPDINYPLTLANIVLFRERLLTGRDVLQDAHKT